MLENVNSISADTRSIERVFINHPFPPGATAIEKQAKAIPSMNALRADYCVVNPRSPSAEIGAGNTT